MMRVVRCIIYKVHTLELTDLHRAHGFTYPFTLITSMSLILLETFILT